MGTNHVEVVHTDFEIAAINVIGATVPRARIQGCFFHLSQSVYRKVWSSGHQDRYYTDEEFAVKVQSVIPFASVTLSGNDSGVYCTTVHFQMRMLPALAFLPIADIPDAFEDLLQVFPTEAASVAYYFEDVYIGRRRRNGMSTAMFKEKSSKKSIKLPDLVSVFSGIGSGSGSAGNMLNRFAFILQVFGFLTTLNQDSCVSTCFEHVPTTAALSFCGNVTLSINRYHRECSVTRACAYRGVPCSCLTGVTCARPP
ncbi:hypothetical protein HPB48_022317 [Haemaphysalis longicornis]|uniref:MULE transposase domain-containing protein n=1 Tax=Haemaphysalis longicornis TaxID=44386 RepID=A0A9J6GAY2_HAELO|nr:hypothetical protein HPB48_022317 [Haemaphysalis longicornis]